MSLAALSSNSHYSSYSRVDNEMGDVKMYFNYPGCRSRKVDGVNSSIESAPLKKKKGFNVDVGFWI